MLLFLRIFNAYPLLLEEKSFVAGHLRLMILVPAYFSTLFRPFSFCAPHSRHSKYWLDPKYTVSFLCGVWLKLRFNINVILTTVKLGETEMT